MINAKTLERAIEFAGKAHKGAFRKGDGRPYIMHPLSVMNKIQSIKKSNNALLLAAAAVLHDTVEDCGVELDTIAKEFGYYTAGLVEELTLDKEKYETIGKTKYLSQEMTKMSSYALCIKLCDRLDNVQDMASMGDEFIARYSKETISILDYVMKHRTKLSKTHIALMGMITSEIEEL
jgi:(p)ppGpp synthase/HD superfamily hydrolase